MAQPTPRRPELTFRASESVRAGVLRLADELLRHAAKMAALPDRDLPTGIHETRLVLKRYRALWRLLRPTLGERLARAENRRLQRVAQRLATARDAAAGLKAFGPVEKQSRKSERPLFTRLRQHLEQAAHAEHAQPARLRTRLKEAGRALAASRAALGRQRWPREGWEVLESGLRAAYRRTRRRFKAARTQPDAEHLHDWRTAAKTLLYQLRLLAPARPRRIGALLSELDHLQEDLGQEHDLALLEARFTRPEPALGSATSLRPVVEALRRRRTHLARRIFRRARTLLKPKPSEFTADLHRDWRRWRKG